MIFVTGPMFSGKEEYICRTLGWSSEEFSKRGVRDAEILAASVVTSDDRTVWMKALEELAIRLSKKEVVIASETGAGVVPVDPVERLHREAAGRLAVMLAERAETVVRVVCGLPQILKGDFQ